MRKLRGMVAAACLLAACGDDDDGGPKTIPYDTLAEYGLFEGTGATQVPAAGVIPYDVIAPLYSDETVKHRFLAVPAGQQIAYHETDRWDLPLGSIVVKTFAYPVDARDPALGERLLETRLLIKEAVGWTAHTYVWNAEQTEAKLTKAGTRIAVEWIDATGAARGLDYRVPNTNQCQACHGEAPGLHLLGPRTRQLNMLRDYGAGPVNQIDHLAELGLLDLEPLPAAMRATITDYRVEAEPLELRARSYLEANCAHCHNTGSPAESSGLILALEETDPTNLGICRRPFSAGDGTGGFSFDVVPGHPESSVMIFRVSSTDPEIKMPEVPTVTSDPTGVAILTAWILAMPGDCTP